MGWMGWSYKKTIKTPIPMIMLAQEGRVDMIKTVLISAGIISENTQPASVKMSDTEGVKSLFMRIKEAKG